MKTNTTHLFATAALLATFVLPTTVLAGTHLENRGRAGYALVKDKEPAPMAMNNSPSRDASRETNVAMMMEKPEMQRGQLQNMGRAGYQYVATSNPRH